MKALGRLWTFYATALVLGVVLAALYHTGWLSSLDFLPSSVRSSDTSQASTHSPALWGVAKAYAHHEALDAEPLIVQLRRDALASGVQPSIDMSRALGKHLRQGLVMTGATPHRLILFSFDDGPDRHITPKLLDQLDQYGIRALFFLTAMRIRGDTRRSREQAEIAREIVRRGHVIGNHSVDHPQMPTLGNPDVRYQIETSTRIFERVLGARPWLFRPPGGARSERVDRMIEERGYTIAMWNLGTGDTQVRDAQGVFGTWKRVLSRLEREEGNRGGIVLLHDIHPWSLDAFRLIVEELRRRNCALLKKGEELYDILDDPRLFFMPRTLQKHGTSASMALLSESQLAQRQAALRKDVKALCDARSQLQN